MAKHVSTYPGLLIMPNGNEVQPGAEVDLTADDAKNAGVAGWVSDGLLVEVPKADPKSDK